MLSSRRAERESRALHTVTRDIPDLLRASPRANHGVSGADLVVDPSPNTPPSAQQTSLPRADLKIRVQTVDPLQAAARVSDRPYAARSALQSPRGQTEGSLVTIHNMASLSRPGGGFLSGANSQEEFLCARSTLYASLFHDFYPLPEFGGIFSPDVLVFRDVNGVDVPKSDRFFVNVITAGVPRHPDARGRIEDQQEATCTCGVSYCDRDRDIVTRKMKAVLRIAQAKRTTCLILGAWGCGRVGNHPVKEVAKLWRKVLRGSARQRRPNAEQWEGIHEVIFAVPHSEHAREFRRAFDDVLEPEEDVFEDEWNVDEQTASHSTFVFGSSPKIRNTTQPSPASGPDLAALMATASSLQLQIEQSRNAFLRNRLRDDLHAINTRLAHVKATSHAARPHPHHIDFPSETDDDVENDYVVSGFAASDGEEYHRFSPSGSSSDEDLPNYPRPNRHNHRPPGTHSARSANYEFRFSPDNKPCTYRGTTSTANPTTSYSSFSSLSPSPSPDDVDADDADDDDEDDDDEEAYYSSLLLAPYNAHLLPPEFDSSTGWFHGSIDALMSTHHLMSSATPAALHDPARRKMSFEGDLMVPHHPLDPPPAEVLATAAEKLRRKK